MRDGSRHDGDGRDDGAESSDEDDGDDDLSLDADFPLGDGTAATEGEVWCPYCGEANEVSLDPGSGTVQDYVEDCQVCCRPWRVTVRYHGDGSAEVRAVASDDDDGW